MRPGRGFAVLSHLRMGKLPLRPRSVAAAVLVLGGVVGILVNWPGSLEDDSFAQLREGRIGVYSFWHPPVMSWMLGLSDAITPGAAYFVLFCTLLAFAAMISLLWLSGRVSWAAAACAAVIVILPQVFLFQATVWKDVLFADACLAGFVCLAHAAHHWPMLRRRITLLSGSGAFLALAMLARQNGIIVLPCAAVALGAAALLHKERRRTAFLSAVAFTAACCLLAWGANAALSLRSDGTPALEDQFKTLELYDITGMVKRDPDIRLAILQKDSPQLAALIRTDGVPLWSPVKNDTLELSEGIVNTLDDTPAETMARQWHALILAHPGTYFAVRAELFAWLFLPVDVALCHPFHVGEEGDPDDLEALHMQPRLDARDVVLWHYAGALQGTPVFWHPLYALMAIAGLVLLVRRRRPADFVMAGLLAASLVFTASFFVISIACDYRYLYLLDLSALASALYLAADWPRKRGPKGPFHA